VPHALIKDCEIVQLKLDYAQCSFRHGCSQGCGTSIPIFGSSFRHLNFFGSSSKTIWSKKSEKTLLYLHNSLAPQTVSVEPEPKFQALAPPSKDFWLWLQPSKIARAPAPQP